MIIAYSNYSQKLAGWELRSYKKQVPEKPVMGAGKKLWFFNSYHTEKTRCSDFLIK